MNSILKTDEALERPLNCLTNYMGRICREYVLELVHNFRQTGSVASKKRLIELTIINEVIKVAILDHVEFDYILSTRKLVTVLGVPRSHKMHTLLNERKN